MNLADHIQQYGEIPLVVEPEIGRCMMRVSEILALAEGSVIKLTVPAGSKIQVFAGGAPFASGDLVKIGDTAVIRIGEFGRKKGD
jgi:flagellar motor switch/type III secretory pathway protein FliN